MRTRLFLVLLLLVAPSCATTTSNIRWQDATKATVSGLTATADIVTEELGKHYSNKCAEMAMESYKVGCDLKSSLDGPLCEPVRKCLDEAREIANKCKGVYRILKLALLAADLGDETTAIEYLGKGIAALKMLYKLVKEVAPGALPDIPILGG